MKTIYVGNLPYSVTEQQITNLVEPHAQVVSVKLVQNRHSGRSRGFGFVTVDTNDIDAVISSIHGVDLNGRELRASEATSREQPIHSTQTKMLGKVR